MSEDKEIKRLEEIIEEYFRVKNIDCVKLYTDLKERVKCVAVRSKRMTELAREMDSLFFSMGFAWNTHVEMRDELDEMAGVFIESGMLTEDRWEEIKNQSFKYIHYVINPEAKMLANIMRSPAMRELLSEIVNTLELNLVENKVKRIGEKHVDRDS